MRLRKRKSRIGIRWSYVLLKMWSIALQQSKNPLLVHLKQAQTTEDKEDLHDVLEMTKAGSEHSNETQGEGSIDNSSPQTPNTYVGLDSVFDVEQELLVDLETICGLCGHSFPTILHSQEIYCPDGCHFQDEEVEEIDSNTSLIEFTEIPQALDERWELLQKFNTEGASRC